LPKPDTASTSKITVLETPNKGNGFIWVVHAVIDGFRGTGRHPNKRAATLLAEKEAKDLGVIIRTDQAERQVTPVAEGGKDGSPNSMANADGNFVQRLRDRRGRRTEELVHQAFAVDFDDAPDWFARIRRPTERQDRMFKIDLIVETHDPAEIYVQIKSSMHGLRKFLESRPPADVIGVVIHPSDSHAKIRAKIFRFVWEKRVALGLAKQAFVAARKPRVKIIEAAPFPRHIPKRLLRAKASP